MFCTKCGNQMPDNAKFCAKCGAPTMKRPAAPTEPYPPAPAPYAPPAADPTRYDAPPVQPAVPAAPPEPAIPAEPFAPFEQGNPAGPFVPFASGKPDVPEVRYEPELPDEPAMPFASEASAPFVPEEPVIPFAPEAPAKPSEPAFSFEPEKAPEPAFSFEPEKAPEPAAPPVPDIPPVFEEKRPMTEAPRIFVSAGPASGKHAEPAAPAVDRDPPKISVPTETPDLSPEPTKGWADMAESTVCYPGSRSMDGISRRPMKREEPAAAPAAPAAPSFPYAPYQSPSEQTARGPATAGPSGGSYGGPYGGRTAPEAPGTGPELPQAYGGLETLPPPVVGGREFRSTSSAGAVQKKTPFGLRLLTFLICILVILSALGASVIGTVRWGINENSITSLIKDIDVTKIEMVDSDGEKVTLLEYVEKQIDFETLEEEYNVPKAELERVLEDSEVKDLLSGLLNAISENLMNGNENPNAVMDYLHENEQRIMNATTMRGADGSEIKGLSISDLEQEYPEELEEITGILNQNQANSLDLKPIKTILSDEALIISCAATLILILLIFLILHNYLRSAMNRSGISLTLAGILDLILGGAPILLLRSLDKLGSIDAVAENVLSALRVVLEPVFLKLCIIGGSVLVVGILLIVLRRLFRKPGQAIE